jgi:YbaB/EbfC DNA-binding family protein
MSYFPDLDSAEQWASDWEARAREQLFQAQEMAARVGDLKATAENRDRTVSVTVEANGVPTTIKLSEAVSGWHPDRISNEIMATMAKAQAKLTVAVTQVADETVGADSETGRAVLNTYHNRFPAPPDDEPNDRSQR